MVSSGTVASPTVTNIQCPHDMTQSTMQLKDFVTPTEQVDKEDQNSVSHVGVDVDPKKTISYAAQASGKVLVLYSIKITYPAATLDEPTLKVTTQSGTTADYTRTSQKDQVEFTAKNTSPESSLTAEVELQSTSGQKETVNIVVEFIYCVKPGRSYARSTCCFR